MLLAGLYPMVRVVISWVMRITGFGYLTAENAGKFFYNPWALLLFVPALVLWTLIPLGGIFGIAYLAGCSCSGVRCSVDDTISMAAYSTFRIFHPKNLLLLVLFIPAALLTHLANAIRFLWNFLPTSFWNGIRYRRPWLFAVMALAVLLLFWLFVRLRYLFPIWMSGRTDAAGAAALSWRMTARHALGATVQFLGIQVQLLVLYATVLVLMTMIVTLGGNILHLSGEHITSVVVVIQKVLFTVYDTAIAPVLFTRICCSYYCSCSKQDEEGAKAGAEEMLKHFEEQRSRFRKRPERTDKKRRFSWSVVLLLGSAVILAFYLYGSARGRYRLRIAGIETMQITAHRGASMQRPENTMAAFTEALEQGADWIELDVHESADGQIFVMHDSNFRRTTGVDANVWELTWDEISRLDAGSFFSPEYAGEKIPLLSQVLEFASENGVSLNIELKPTGHEKNLVESVVALVQEYAYEENCVVTSQSYATVEKVREYSEIIRTVYVSSLAYGAVNRMSAADAFSVQSVSISRSLVRNLHNRGIEGYAWTVDSRKNINRMIDYGVDNIITNNVPLARKCIRESQASQLTGEIIHSLNALFT